MMLILGVGVLAQQPTPPEAEYPYRRDIEKGKFDRAADKILRHISRDASSLELHYAAFQLFSHPGYPGHCYDSAYNHLLQVRSIYSRADAKYLDRWARDSYSSALIDHSLATLCRKALMLADSVRTPDAYQHFLAYYTQASDALRDSAIASRDTLEFRLAQSAGTLEMVEAFILRRPSSYLVSDAIRLRDSLAFDIANRQHTTVAYDMFRNAYPRSYLYAQATDSVYAIDYRDCLRHDAEQYYRSYASRYPQSPYAALSVWHADSIEYHREVDTTRWQSVIEYLDRHGRPGWQDSALHVLTRYALAHRHVQSASQLAHRLSPGSHDHTLVARFLHQAYITKSINNFHRFYLQFPTLMSAQQRHHDSLAFVANQVYQPSIADSCIRAVAPSHEALAMLRTLIQPDISRGRYADALASAEKYATYFSDDYDYQRMLVSLSTQASSRTNVTAFPMQVNSISGNETAPMLSADGQTLYFTANHRTDNIGSDDIFVARRKGKGWGMAQIEMDLSHTYGSERVHSVSPDGNRLLIAQGSSLSIAQRISDGWQMERIMPNVGPDKEVLEASLAANGRVLMLSVRSTTEREIDSSLNLYVSLLSQEGEWLPAIELGPTVNTPFAEYQPFLHPDMRTLYFMSGSHGALSQADLFMTTRLDDTWRHWSTPINVSRQLNADPYDQHYTINSDGNKCYFTHLNNNHQEMCIQDLPVTVRPQPVYTINGTVRDLDGQPVDATVFYEDPVTGQLLGQCQTDPKRGTYTLLLPLGRRYSVYVHHVDYFPASQQIDLTDQHQRAAEEIDFVLTPLQLMIDQGASAQLRGVSFDVANPQFSVTAQAELKRLAHLIRDNGYQVEISVHVEGNVGDAENLALTQLRANAIRDYLLQLGCRSSDISARGYGSDRPLTISNQVSSATARPQSRRVEVRLSE